MHQPLFILKHFFLKKVTKKRQNVFLNGQFKILFSIDTYSYWF